MLTVTPATIRDSAVNMSKKELSDLSLPVGFDTLDFERLDYLGWRDPKIARRAYITVPTGGGLVTVMLRQADASPRARAQCSWCQDTTLPNPVVLYTARRSGAAGRKGDTVGTLICEDFECSKNVRMLPPVAYLGYDVEAARQDRIATLQVRAADFASSI
jgi:hypothetical protein